MKIRQLTLALGLALITTSVVAQQNAGDRDDSDPPKENPIEEKSTEKDGEVFLFVEQMPEFPGGQQAMYKYIASRAEYSLKAKEQGISGKVYVSFVIEKDGKVSNVQVVRGAHPLLDSAAVKIVKGMPDWKPGMQRGKHVRVKQTLPVIFTLDGDDPDKK
ncbi:MAG: TonB family protein [Bacteroidetes bacterium]|nr:TonB family protein [Bacteroidota bacterium]